MRPRRWQSRSRSERRPAMRERETGRAAERRSEPPHHHLGSLDIAITSHTDEGEERCGPERCRLRRLEMSPRHAGLYFPLPASTSPWPFELRVGADAPGSSPEWRPARLRLVGPRRVRATRRGPAALASGEPRKRRTGQRRSASATLQRLAASSAPEARLPRRTHPSHAVTSGAAARRRRCTLPYGHLGRVCAVAVDALAVLGRLARRAFAMASRDEACCSMCPPRLNPGPAAAVSAQRPRASPLARGVEQRPARSSATSTERRGSLEDVRRPCAPRPPRPPHISGTWGRAGRAWRPPRRRSGLRVVARGPTALVPAPW